MKLIARLLIALFGFVIGVVASVFVVGAYVSATYSCQPGPGEPCDAGGYVGMGLAILLAPILGFAFAALGYWLALRQQRRRAA